MPYPPDRKQKLEEARGKGKKVVSILPEAKQEEAQRLAEFNAKHAGVMIGGKFCILNEVVDPIFNRPDITFSSVSDLRNRYANDLIWMETEQGMKSYSIATAWMKWKGRRHYEGIAFAPGAEVNGHYNLYRGLAVEPKEGDWSLFRKHLEENICGGIGQYYQYLMSWMADTVQDPGGIKPGVSVVLRGGRGTGKGLFAQTFGAIFGPHFLHLQNQGHLVGRFNSHQKDALVIFADECFWAGNKTSEGLLKGIITEPTIRCEPKGKDSYCVQNHIRLIVASNEDWVIPAGMDERRFFVLEVQDDNKQKIKYWNPIWQETRNGGIAAMLFDLLRFRYDKEHLKTPPKTEALLTQIEHTMNCVEQFWYQKLYDGCLLREDGTWEGKAITARLYDEFVIHCKNIGERFIPNEKVFGKQLRKMCSIRRGRESFGNGGKQEWCLIFPELVECRSQFNRLLGMSLPWKSEGF